MDVKPALPHKASMRSELPIDDALPDFLAALRNHGRAVLQAPPGAGKTTRVPLALHESDLAPNGRIIMLEPRRLAARAAAERMAETLGEIPGETVGYRIRGEAKCGKQTRIEVVTEGILTRMIQSDPELSGVGAVIFDEFHERSLNADLGLALCLEIADVLRDDLKLIVMSATLDAKPVAQLMEAPLITSQGRSFPVEIRWRDTALPKRQRLEEATTELILTALHETEGGILVFLPGEGEIRRTQGLIRSRLPSNCILRMLFGALPFKDQRAAIEPAENMRKIVLATAIAETSLTIEDIRVVIDAGRARRARFDPSAGMSRLVTERVTRAEAEQRAGRAGRVAPGLAYRLWTRGEEGALAPFPPPEIASTDLAGLALELALWGAAPADLPLLTQPSPGAYAEAQALLRMLGALDDKHLITAHGRTLAGLPLHPRLAHMLSLSGPDAAPLAALLADRDPLARGAPVDLTLRLEALNDFKRFSQTRPWQVNRAALERIRAEARRLTRQNTNAKSSFNFAEMAAQAYPDRIGQRRKGSQSRYLLSGGKGAILPEEDPLGQSPFLVITDTDGNPREARIRQALPITQAELRALFTDQIVWHDVCIWSKRNRRVTARRQERLGALVLDDRVWRDAPADTVARAMCDGIRDLGLFPSDATERFRARVAIARAAGEDLPAMDDASLLATLEDWIRPHLMGIKTAQDWKSFDLLGPLQSLLTWEQTQRLNQIAPPAFTTPLGRRIPIDYSGDYPEIHLRLQELFGQTTHPTVASQPLRVTLLSPAGRPVQTTLDIPGFWATSYADVRKDMRGRYPRHPWPEDPTRADPTLRAKPR